MPDKKKAPDKKPVKPAPKTDSKGKEVLSRKGFKVVVTKKGTKVNVDFDKKNVRIQPVNN